MEIFSYKPGKMGLTCVSFPLFLKDLKLIKDYNITCW